MEQYDHKVSTGLRTRNLFSVKSNLDTIEVDGFTFAVIEDSFSNYTTYLIGFDAVIIMGTHPQSTYRFCRELRSQTKPELALVPLFLYPQSELKIDVKAWSIDGLVPDLNLLSEAIIYTRKIKESIPKYLPAEHVVHSEYGTLAKTVSFLLSRGQTELVPYLSRDSKFGYRYPILSLFNELDEIDGSIKLLDDAQHKGWLQSTYLDSVYLCNSCQDGFLVYREVCPHCHSSDLKPQDMIHHFRCAHVAPLTEFEVSQGQESFLQCPKCHHELDHIGVDYDKPAVIQHCNHCHKDFQQYEIRAKCTSCQQETPVEYLIKKDIYSYALTTSAKLALYYRGPHAMYQVELEGLTTRRQLHEALKAMNTHNQSLSSVAILKIDKERLLDRVGEGMVLSIRFEMASLLKSLVGPSAEIAFNGFTIHLLLPMVEVSEMEMMLDKYDLLLHTLCIDNLQLKENPIKFRKLYSARDYLKDWEEIIDLMDDD